MNKTDGKMFDSAGRGKGGIQSKKNKKNDENSALGGGGLSEVDFLHFC